MKLSRRETLFALAGLGLAGKAQPGFAAPASLGAIAAEQGLLFGTSIASDTLADPAQAALYRREARIFTVDYAMKFGFLRPTADSFQPGEADAILAFARASAIPVRGHTLAWNESRPDWLMALSTAEMRAALDRHIDETVGYFAGQLHSWDVVNEPFWPGHRLPGHFRDGPWLDAFGEDYVTRAFKRTAAADPAARLVLNEAMTEAWTEDGALIRKSLLGLVDRLQHDGARLDAVGLQGHLLPQKPHDDAAFADFVAELATRKIDIYITELDVDDTVFPDDIGARDAAVAEHYRQFLTAVLAVPAVKMVITWQLADSASWYDHAAREADPDATRLPRPLPFDAHFAPKPAHGAMSAAFTARRPA
ncbi:endo-1,4-beta-xylanase [Kaistia dalseonensis]|uniref:Beta-xylanase n=1 Tax=Kaistia dalseonensis TaxID=410840 RepID=A0ABU0H9A4_9HYPH|nr:endo-1,4-beta-xylanase [Kaistia dalseonensis]MCX5495979.1 endo-1,4-beta-xylanase [Kaistia dalseonensis]MDQ0438582.1 endo-1,4-beta-xylanase [Kaistia dalseonensis]